MKFNSIRFKITAITVAAILVAIFAIVSASAPSTREEAERRSVETMRLVSFSKALRKRLNRMVT